MSRNIIIVVMYHCYKFLDIIYGNRVSFEEKKSEIQNSFLIYYIIGLKWHYGSILTVGLKCQQLSRRFTLIHVTLF
jgi:hypothetical protein